MNPQETGKAYDEITHLWERKVFNAANGIEQHKRALAFVKNRGMALDVGCGCTGRFIELLQTEGFAPEGIDISAKMITLAKKRHPDITFHHQDICLWESQEQYDFITAWDSIWHIPLEKQKDVLTRLVKRLNRGGVLIFSFGGTDEPSEHRNNTMGPEMYYSTLGIVGFLKLTLSLDCTCRHLEYDQHPELHAYLIIQKN
ncbi:trans-aconitate 2-methyltransferase [Microbulbifer sp. NBRC 101763]|uniref:class I SAM-dependent DNA methyltransferase n=1 Tax=unclassified Microbulbifer TaxID=2619833 RepID=UPI0024ACA761|nr:class I SAM-dependent methyltransferase [Microbulbifer sp. MLAF003]WHI52561.1 class I SAM-dependent methyltransferase [Microbulbifer sp. MLAF003]